jgi:hypothetical protein
MRARDRLERAPSGSNYSIAHTIEGPSIPTCPRAMSVGDADQNGEPDVVLGFSFAGNITL